MAKSKKAAKVAAAPAEDKSESTSQGRAIILPNGKRRVDYIRAQYYDKGIERSAIRKALNAMYVDDKGEQTQDIPYQIVFAATKLSRDEYKAELEAKEKTAAEEKAAASKEKADA